MSEEIFACLKCGQVYITGKPSKCIRISISDGECGGIEFKEIEEKDVINIHDLWK